MAKLNVLAIQATIDWLLDTITGVDKSNVTNDVNGEAVNFPLYLFAKSRPENNIQTGAGYTALITDADNLVTRANAGAHTCTLPANIGNTDVDIPLKSVLSFNIMGPGVCTFQVGSGVSLNGTLNGTLACQSLNQLVVAYKVSATSWYLWGDLA